MPSRPPQLPSRTWWKPWTWSGGTKAPDGVDFLYRTLRLQLVAGFMLVLGGGIAGMYFVTHNPSLTAQNAISKEQAGLPAQEVGPTSITTTTTATSAPAGATPTTAVVPITPGGTTSSTVSLVQALALAIVAAGATMIPTGAIGVLAAKVKTEP